MKKILYSVIIAGLALVSAACQKIDEQKITPSSSNDLTVTGRIVNFDGTKVSYAFSDPENVKSGIKPAWEESDEIFGFDENGTSFTFTVSGIDSETGKATFTVPTGIDLSGKLYAVYYPGEHSFTGEGAEKTLTVDISSQSGSLDGSTPVIMCATGTIDENNNVNFDFVNQTAIVGIYKMQVYNDGAPVVNKAVTNVKLKGAVVDGTIKVKDGILTLEAGTTSAALTASVEFTTNEAGDVDVDPDAIAPYFAVIPQEDASLTIEATCSDNLCATNAAMTGAIVAGQYYYLGKKIYGGTVAKIGETGYATISEAFAAANGGQTITLENNCTVDKQTLVEGKSITLDLNDKTLTFNGTGRIYVMEGAGLTIKDDGDNKTGTIIQSAKGSNVISLTHASSNLTIEGGKITCVEGQTAATVYVTAGTLTMTGGEITGEKVGISMSSVDGSTTPTVSVSGNAKVTSTGSNAISASAGNLTITGGYFAGKGINNYAAVYKSETSTATVEISGGYYSKAPVDGLLKTGYVCVANTDAATKNTHPKQVKPIVATLTIEDGEPLPFATIEAAADEANKDENKAKNCTITLNADCTMGSNAKNVSNTAGVILDLNGKTLTQNGSARFGVTTGGKLTIADSSTEKSGKITQTRSDSYTIKLDDGEMTIADGTIDCADSPQYATVYVTGGTLDITGGTITNTVKATINIKSGNVTVSEDAKVNVTVNNNAIYATGGTLTINGGFIANAAGASSAVIFKTTDGDATFNIYGGYYSKAVKADYLDDSHECVDNTDPETMSGYPKKVIVPVTLIIEGGEPLPFATIEAAADEANKDENKAKNCTITLNADCTMGSNAKNVSNTAGVILDLNGKTLTQNGSKRFGVTTGGKLTIADSSTEKSGKITQTRSDSYTIKLDDGEMTIADGTIDCADSPQYATVYVTGGTLNVNDGTITSTAKLGVSVAGGIVNISNGIISGVNNAISASAGNLTITGGYFAGKGTYAAVYKSETSTATVEISGGYYSKAPVDGLLKTGYVCVDSSEYPSYPKKVQAK